MFPLKRKNFYAALSRIYTHYQMLKSKNQKHALIFIPRASWPATGPRAQPPVGHLWGRECHVLNLECTAVRVPDLLRTD